MKKIMKGLAAAITTLTLSACGSSSGSSPVVVTEPSPTPTPDPIPVVKKVLVIGAGMSGIKAAHKLAAAGFDVQVLEGRDRLGGRTWSNNTMGTPLDMGASWIHGIEGNPIHQLATDLSVPLVEWNYENQVTYDHQGNIDYDIGVKIQSVESDLNAWGMTAVVNDSDATVQDAINIGVQNGGLDHMNSVEVAFMTNMLVEQDSAADASDLSIAGMEDEGEFGGPDVIFPQGYDALVKAMAADLDVKLNTWVKAIRYDQAMVSVETSQGDFEADYVIVTVPLGVLKKGVIEFSPALPQNKLAAIAALDMGVLNKVYLHFDEVFWDNTVTNMANVSEQKGHWSYWINLEPATGKPILGAFNAASYGKEIEDLTDEQIVAKAMETLKTMYGNDIPQPADHLITRWGKDEFTYGSYSYIPKGATSSMRDDLAEPVDGKVLFAGEATNSEYPSTVHGAFLSGEREADRVIGLAGG